VAERSRATSDGDPSTFEDRDPAENARRWIACCELEAHGWMRQDESELEFNESQPGFRVLKSALEQEAWLYDTAKALEGEHEMLSILDVSRVSLSFCRSFCFVQLAHHRPPRETSEADSGILWIERS
jgi:hypothetical protein